MQVLSICTPSTYTLLTAELWVVRADGRRVQLGVGLPGGCVIRVVVGLDAPVEYPLGQVGKLPDEQSQRRRRLSRHRLSGWQFNIITVQVKNQKFALVLEKILSYWPT